MHYRRAFGYQLGLHAYKETMQYIVIFLQLPDSIAPRAAVIYGWQEVRP